VTPILIVLIAGVVAHTIVGVITRTPEEDQTPLRWKAWHSFIVGLASTAVLATIVVLYAVLTGVMLPFWTLILAADVITLGWKLHQHYQRTRERRALKNLMDRPAFGEEP
jgi:uncharacterized BrkB/YihY/UPF0761 family membrane protein